MSRERDDRLELDPRERAIVERAAEFYAAPPLSASQRVRFDAQLAERLSAPAHGRARLAASLGAAAVALGAVLGLWLLPAHERPDAQIVSAASTPLAVVAQDEDAILAAVGPIANADDALPEDYRAISDLVIGE